MVHMSSIVVTSCEATFYQNMAISSKLHPRSWIKNLVNVKPW